MAEPRSRRGRAIERPFPGLRPFMREENLIFFGREGQTDALISRLQQNHFLAVLGSSGSGKSSLVRAGLLPALEGGLMSSARPQWKMAVIRPGDRPVEVLSQALAELVSRPDDPGFKFITPKGMMETMLMASSFGLKEAAMGPILAPNENLLVVVDQFEEIFRFNEGQDEHRMNEARAFVRLLLEASNDPSLPIYVVITMRSDFLGECPRFADLPEAINAGQYLVPRLTRAQLREAITGPIAVFKGNIAPDLVIRLLNELGDNSDQLPILQHALMRTWAHHAPGSEIGIADYEAIGGLGNALNQHAEEIFDELREQELGLVTEQLFKCLTHMESDGKGIRRPTRLSEICRTTGANEDKLKYVVEAFRAQGRSFLMPPRNQPLEHDTVLDIGHESFMRLWARLGDWVREEFRSAEEYQRLSWAALDYRDGKVNLWRQPELGIALKWKETVQPTKAWSERYDPHFDLAMAFLDQSLAAWEKEEEEKAALVLMQQKAEERKKTVRRLWSILFIMGAMLTFTLTALVVAWQQKRRADTQSELADRRADTMAYRLKVNESLLDVQKANLDSIQKLSHRSDSLNALLQVQLSTISEQQLALQNSVARLRQTNDSLDRIRRRLAANNKSLASANDELEGQKAEQERLRRIAEEKRLLADRRAGILEALQLAERSLVAPNDSTASFLARSAYALMDSLRGQTFDSKLYNALQSAMERFSPMVRKMLDVVPVAMDYNPKDDVAYIMSMAGEVWEFREEDGKTYFMPKQGVKGNDLRLLSHSAGHLHLIVSTLNNDLLLYRTVGGLCEHKFVGHKSPVTGAVELPGRDRLLSCDLGGGLLLWGMGKAAGGPPTPVDNGYLGKAHFYAMAISPAGDVVAVAKEREILLVNVANMQFRGSIKVQDKVTALEFDPKGNRLAYGLDNGAVGFHDFHGEPTLANRVHASRVSAISFSPDGRYVASASFDQTLRLWFADSLQWSPIVLKGHKDWVTGIGFAKDSKRLFSVSKDKTIRYWYTDIGDLEDELATMVKVDRLSDPDRIYYEIKQAPVNLNKGK